MTIVPYDDTVGENYLSPGTVMTGGTEGVWGPAFRTENPVVSAYNYLMRPAFEDQEDFDFEERVRTNPLATSNPDAFVGVRSDAEFDFQLTRLEQERRDRETLAANGWAGMGAAMMAGLLSPTILLPGGALGRGAGALRTATSVGAWAMVGASVDEGILYMTQEERTGLEVGLNIGTAGILGGVLGGIAGSLPSRTIRQFEDDMLNPQGNTVIITQGGNPNSLSAAANESEFIDPGGLYGLNSMAMAHVLGPVNRTLTQDISPTARRVQAQLSTAGMVTDRAARLEGPSQIGGEVAELVKQYHAMLGVVREGITPIYRNYLRTTSTGSRLHRGEFEELVGQRLNDPNLEVPLEVAKAADLYRENLYRPMAEEARRIGLPQFADLSPEEIESYFTRMLRNSMTQDDRTALREVLEEHFEEVFQETFQRRLSRVEEALAKDAEELDDISLDAEQIAGRRQELETEIASLPQRFPEGVRNLAEEIRALRAQARAAEDVTIRKALRDQADAMGKANRDTLEAFNKAERRLRSRFRNLDHTVAGLEEQQRKVLQRIEALEDQQINTITVAINRARKVLARQDALGDDFVAAAAKLRGELERAYQVYAKSENQLDKLRRTGDDFEELVNSDTRPTDKISRGEARQQQRADALEELMDELDALEDGASEAVARTILSNAVRNLGEVAQSVNHRRSVRIEELRKRATDYDPANNAARRAGLEQSLIERRLGFLEDVQNDLGGNIGAKTDPTGARFLAEEGNLQDVVDFRQAAKDVAANTATKLHGEGQRIPALAMVGLRGSMKARTLNIDPTRIWSNGRKYGDFLDWNAERVARHYVRQMGSDIELHRAFGSVNPLETKTKLVTDIQDEFNARRREIEGDTSLTDRKRERSLGRLENTRAQVFKDLEAQIARLRHVRGVPDDPTAIGYRAGAFMLNLNVLRLMGTATIASIPEMAVPVMKNGLLNTFRDGIVPLITNFKTLKASMNEAKFAGVGHEMALQGRAGALLDVVEEAGYGTRGERGVQWATNQFGLWSGLTQWTHGMKMFSTALINARMVRAIRDSASGAINDRELKYLFANGIDQNQARLMWNEIANTPGGGDELNGVVMPNTVNWRNPDLARMYRAALSRQVDSTVVTPGLERPLWMDGSMTARLIAQFRSFTFASTQRVILAGYQDARLGGHVGVMAGVVMSLGLGMVSYYLWAVARGGDRYTEMMNASEEKWMIEAITRSGMLGVLSEAHTMAQNIPATSNIATLGTGTTSNRAFANPFERVLGPTFGALQDAQRIVVNPQSESGVNALRRLMPLQNLSYMAWLFDDFAE